MTTRPFDAGPRRLVLWTDSFWPRIGGAESWSLRMVRDLTALGYDIRIVEVGQDARERREVVGGAPILRVAARRALESGGAGEIAACRAAVIDFLDGFEPQLVVVSAYGAEALLMLSLIHGRLAAPWLAVVHAEWPDAHMAKGSMVERLLSRAARILVFEPKMADWLARVDAANAGKSAVLLQAAPDPGPVASRTGQGLLFCGRLTEQKGGDVAIAAFAQVAARFPEASLTVVGDGPLLAILRVQAGTLDVRFTGAVAADAMTALYDAAAVVLMPSRFEPFGLVALEAAWRARPVVASAVGGLAMVIEDGVTGVLCAAHDVDGFAAAAMRMLEDPVWADALGGAARLSAERRFDWRAHVGSFARLMADSAGLQLSE